MDAEDTRRFFLRHTDAWNRHDVEAVARDYEDGAVLVSPMFGPVRGREAIEASCRTAFHVWPDSRHDDEELIVEGDRVCRITLSRGTFVNEFMGLPPTGKPFRMRIVWIYEMHGDRIAREQRLYDFTNLLLQLGILKAKAIKAAEGEPRGAKTTY